MRRAMLLVVDVHGGCPNCTPRVAAYIAEALAGFPVSVHITQVEGYVLDEEAGELVAVPTPKEKGH